MTVYREETFGPVAPVVIYGMGDSGIGREGGHQSLDEYLETKTAGISLR